MFRKEPKKNLHIRMPEAELNRLKELAVKSGMEFSEFLRQSLKGAKELKLVIT